MIVDVFNKLVGSNTSFELKGEPRTDNTGYQVTSSSTKCCLLSETVGVKVENKKTEKPETSDCFQNSGHFTKIATQMEKFLVEFNDVCVSTLFAKNLIQERLNISSKLQQKLEAAEEFLLWQCPTAEFMFRKQAALSLLTAGTSTTLTENSPDQDDSQSFFCRICDSMGDTSKCSKCSETGVSTNKNFREEWNRLFKQKQEAKDLKHADALMKSLSECISFLTVVEATMHKAAEKQKRGKMNSKEFEKDFFKLFEELTRTSDKPQPCQNSSSKRWTFNPSVLWNKAWYKNGHGTEERIESSQIKSNALETYTTPRSHFLCSFAFWRDFEIDRLILTSFDSNPGCATFSLSGHVVVSSQPLLKLRDSTSAYQLNRHVYANEVLFCFVDSRGYVCVISQNPISLNKAILIFSILKPTPRTPSIHHLESSLPCIQHAAYISDVLHLIAMVSPSIENTDKPSLVSIQVLSNEKGSGDFFQFSAARRSASKEMVKIRSVQFIPRLRFLSILYEDSLVHIWKVDSLELRFRVTFLQTFDCLSYSPDGCHFLLAKATDREQLNISVYRMCTLPGDRQVDETCRLSSINVRTSLDSLANCYFLATAVAKSEIRISFVSVKATVILHCNFPLDPRKIDTNLVKDNECKIRRAPLEAFQTALQECLRVFPIQTPCDSNDLNFGEELVVIRRDDEDWSDLEISLKKWLGSQIISNIKMQGKSAKKLTFLKNVLVKSMKSLNNHKCLKMFNFGNWIIKLICLLPVQIVRANESHVLPINSGVKVMTVERLSTKKENRRVLPRSNLCDGMDFGPIESVIEHYGGRVKVISNIGRTSTGKSYLGNHLFGSLFEVAPRKCTNGIWMSCRSLTCHCSICTNIPEDHRAATLLVAFDVEGFDSIDRVLRGDTLLSQLVFSLSSTILLNTREKALDRGIQRMLKNFASGVSETFTADLDKCEEHPGLQYGNFIHGDKALFAGTFVPLLKDIQRNEIEALNCQIHDEMIETKNRTPHLNVLFKETATAMLQPLQTLEYYRGVSDLFFEFVQPSLCIFQNGAWFLHYLRAVVRQLMTNENRSLQDYFIETTKMHVTDAIEDALVRGRFSSFAGDIEIPDDYRISTKPFIVDITLQNQKKYIQAGRWKGNTVFVCYGFCNFVTNVYPDGQELALERDGSKLPLSQVQALEGELIKRFATTDEFKLMESDDSYVLGDTYNGPKTFLSQMFDLFRRENKRNEYNERTGWQPSFFEFVLSVVERRCNRVKLWFEELAQDLRLEKQASDKIIPPAIQHRYRHFSESFCMCGAVCGRENCQFTCLLPYTHATGKRDCHDCLNEVHVCQKGCMYDCKEEENGPLAKCTKGAGHDGISGDSEHKCSSKNHKCLHNCRFCQNGCTERCNETAGHEGAHDCGNQHMCSNKCSVLFCPAECTRQIDHQHSLCLCNESRCNYQCEMPGCFNFCREVHGHVSEKSSPHLCGQTHECPALCQHVGVCKRINRSDQTLLLFAHVSDTSHETVEASEEYSIQIPQVAKCSKLINVSRFSHEEQHCCRENHSCREKCPLCHKLCTKSVSSTGIHAGRHGIENGHGLMLYSYLASMNKDDTLQGRDRVTKYSTSDYLYRETCADVCLLNNVGGRGHCHVCNIHDDWSLNSLRYRPFEMKLNPDDGYRKGLFPHTEFWKIMKFDDPCRNEEFDLCPARCKTCVEIKNCTRKLWHDDGVEHNQSSACLNEACSVSTNGHHFECNHIPKFHIVFVFDTSGSMRASDWRPSSDIDICIHKTCQNRFGAVLLSALEMLQSRQWITNRCQVTMITFSVVGHAFFKRKSLEEAIKTFADILKNGIKSSLFQEMVTQFMLHTGVFSRNSKDITLSGYTSFVEGLKEANSAIEENLKDDETPVIAFFSDGHNNACKNNDIKTQIEKLGNLSCQPPRMYLIYSEREAAEVFSMMKEWFEKKFIGQSSSCKVECFPCTQEWKELKDQFMKIAEDCAQRQFVVVKTEDYNQQLDWLRIQEQSDTAKLQSRPARLVLSSAVYFKLLVFFRPIWSKFANQISYRQHILERQETSVLLYGNSHDCLNEIMKDLALPHGFQVYEIEFGGHSGTEQRDEIIRAFQRGRDAASGSRVLLLFSQLDLAFHSWDSGSADTGEPEFLLQLELLKLKPPENVDLCVCCTSSNPWAISNQVLRSFSLLVEVSHPTEKEISKIVNSCFSSAIQENRDLVQQRLNGCTLSSIYKCLKSIGSNVDGFLQDDSSLEKVEENIPAQLVPDHIRDRIQTKQQALRYFDGKRRLSEMSHDPPHCGVLVESDIFQYYSGKLPLEQRLWALIGEQQYKTIERYCMTNSSAEKVSCVLIVGANDALNHWISSFIAHKVAGWYTWIAANTLKLCYLQKILFQRLLDTTTNSVVIYTESLDEASKYNLTFLNSLAKKLVKRKKRLHIIVSASADGERKAKQSTQELQWWLDATIKNDVFLPLGAAARNRQRLHLLLDINYSNWSNISNEHVSWIAAETKERSFQEAVDVLRKAFDRTLVDYIDCTHVQAVALTKFDESNPPMNGHYFIASTSDALCAVPLTDKISTQAEFKLSPRRLTVEDVALVLKLPTRFCPEKLGNTERVPIEENEKRILKISCDYAVVSVEIQKDSLENACINDSCKPVHEEFAVTDSDSEAASMQTLDVGEPRAALQKISELHNMVSKASEDDSENTDNLPKDFFEMTAFFCSPGQLDPPCIFTNGEYKLGPVFYFGEIRKALLSECFRASITLPSGFSLFDSDVCLWHSKTKEYQIPKWKKVQLCRCTDANKRTTFYPKGPPVTLSNDNMSFATKKLSGFWAWTKCQSPLSCTISYDYVACLYATQCPKKGTGWKFRVYVLPKEQLQVCGILNVSHTIHIIYFIKVETSSYISISVSCCILV